MSRQDYRFEPQPSARGAQGDVYFGVRSADGTPVAMKVASGGRGAAEALKREIQVLQTLGRARVGGVVQCLDVLDLDGRMALVMPRYPRHLGDWLNQAVVSPGPKTLRQALRYCSSVAYTLGRIHQTPWGGGTLVHRDIKPENVFLDESGAPHVGDFGGAMAIDGLARVELGLFGTPMWAPLDQILPGQAIPDPTWDTYALCVFLYAAVTGARPAYQSDPRTLLTATGRDLWEVGRKAVEGAEAERLEWAKHFSRMRRGSKASDLVDVTGHGALVDADRAAIDQGLKRLCRAAGIPDSKGRSISRALWDLLVRGLSPVSHPSPPNRFRDGVELGELLDELRERVSSSVARTPAGAADRVPTVHAQATLTPVDLPRERPASGLGRGLGISALIGLGLVGGAALVGAGWVYREPLMRELAPLMKELGPVLGLGERARIEGGKAVLADGTTVDVSGFEMSRTETRVSEYAACVAAGACPDVAQRLDGDYPVLGLSLSDAEAYCAWAGGAVPDEAQWMLAVGPAPMPWGGEDPTCDHATALGCGEEVRPVGSTPRGRTAAGVHDLAGNAWEWATTPDGGVLLGGDARSPLRGIGRGGRKVVQDGSAVATSGVRCVWPLDG